MDRSLDEPGGKNRERQRLLMGEVLQLAAEDPTFAAELVAALTEQMRRGPVGSESDVSNVVAGTRSHLTVGAEITGFATAADIPDAWIQEERDEDKKMKVTDLGDGRLSVRRNANFFHGLGTPHWGTEEGKFLIIGDKLVLVEGTRKPGFSTSKGSFSVKTGNLVKGSSESDGTKYSGDFEEGSGYLNKGAVCFSSGLIFEGEFTKDEFGSLEPKLKSLLKISRNGQVIVEGTVEPGGLLNGKGVTEGYELSGIFEYGRMGASVQGATFIGKSDKPALSGLSAQVKYADWTLTISRSLSGRFGREFEGVKKYTDGSKEEGRFYGLVMQGFDLIK
jgi:hypothetical protein